MPIAGLSQRMRWPRLGRIGLGVVVKKDGKEYPRQVDYFVLPDELKAIYGERPKQLPVLFPSDDLDRVFPHFYERYQAGVKTLRCDGQQAVEFAKDGTRSSFQCQRPDAFSQCRCGAGPTGTLNVMLPDAEFGIWSISIGGAQPIADLLADLEMARAVLGRLTGVIFTLERVPVVRQVMIDGRMARKETYPVRLRKPGLTTLQALREGGARVIGVGEAAQPMALNPAPQNVSDAEVEPEPEPEPVREAEIVEDHSGDHHVNAAAPASDLASSDEIGGLYSMAAMIDPKIDKHWFSVYLRARLKRDDVSWMTRSEYEECADFLRPGIENHFMRSTIVGVIRAACRQMIKREAKGAKS